MANLILAGITFICGLVFLIIAKAVKKDEQFFKLNHKKVTVTLVGFRLSGSNRSPVVTFIDESGKDRKEIAKANGRIFRTCEKGTLLQAEYLDKKVFGIDFCDIRVTNPQFALPDPKISINIVYGLSMFFMTVSIVLAITGFFLV